MEEVLEGFLEVGYEKLDENSWKLALADGPKSVLFTQLVEWISKELQQLYSLDEHVNAISSPDDSSSFLMELSSLLREIGCSYSVLTEGHLSQRLQSESSRILLLDYLLTELKSARMIQIHKPDESLQVKLNESSTAAELKNILMTLKFSKPPANIPAKMLFSKVEDKLKEILPKVPVPLYGEPLFVGKLSDKQWHALETYYKELFNEYRMRRELLLKRLDVTIQSFEWSGRLKQKSDDIKKSFSVIRRGIVVEPNVKISDILAARKDLAILEKTSSASVRRKTQCDINKHIIGHVPDRGGRPNEQEPPPPEMPSWQQRNAGGASGPRRGGGGGARNNNFQSGGNPGKQFNADSSHGGRVQAGWNAQPQRNFQNTGYDNRGGYQNQDNRGNDSYGGNYQGNSYDNRQSRGGFNTSRGRGGGYQSHCDRSEYQDYRNRNDGSRTYYQR